MTELEIKPKLLNYQRNGVGGVGFYVLTFDWKDTDGETGKNFLATFELTSSDTASHVCPSSFDCWTWVKLEPNCRIVDPKRPLQAWRGDVFSTGISKALKKIGDDKGIDNVYDLQEVINKSAAKKRVRI